jgi:hypothetical protein
MFKVGDRVSWLHLPHLRRYGTVAEIEEKMIGIDADHDGREIYLEPRVLQLENEGEK